MNKILLLVALFVIIGAIAYRQLFMNGSMLPADNSRPDSYEEPVTENSSDERLGLIAVPEGWQMYLNSDLKFRINYPQNTTPQANGDFSVLFTSTTPSIGQGDPSFFYVSHAPKTSKFEAGEVYNYNQNDIEKLKSIPVGQSASISDNEGQREWYTYTRLPDTTLSGQKAYVFENKKPWEFPGGTTETRYIIETENEEFLVGYYIQNDKPLYPFAKENMDQMVTSFSILTGEETLQ